MGPITLKRGLVVELLMLAVFVALLLRVLLLQTVDFEKYQSKVIDQLTVESAVAADRGNIYDRQGRLLATNVTAYRVFIAPRSIQAVQEEKYGKDLFHCWRDPHRTETPFSDDTDLMDNQVSIAEYRNHIRVSFTSTMSNAIPERRMCFHCSEGTLDLDLYKMQIRYKKLGDEGETVITMEGDGHGGGDNFIMKELYDTMQNGTAPACSGNEGLESAVFALAIDRAAQTGSIVDLEPIWKSLGR